MRSAKAVLFCALLASAGPARAQVSPGPYELGRQDYAWIPLAAAAGIGGQIRFRDMAPADTAHLDRQKDLWAMDRWAAGYFSPEAALASDLVLYPLVVLPVAVTILERVNGRQTAWDAVADAVVYGEAMILSSGIDLWVRSLRIHARPLVYNSGIRPKERLSSEASGSFYSGHSNAAFLSATYFSYTWSLRNPGSRAQPWIWAATLGAASTVAGLRIAAGKHYLSDVLVGAAAGAGFGLLFPWMHRRERGGAVPEVGLRSNGRDVYPELSWRF